MHVIDLNLNPGILSATTAKTEVKTGLKDKYATCSLLCIIYFSYFCG